MKVNIYTQNPEKIEESLKFLQDSVMNNSLINNKVVIEWKKIAASPDGKYSGYQVEFTYEHQFGWANKLLWSEFEKKIKKLDPTATLKKL